MMKNYFRRIFILAFLMISATLDVQAQKTKAELKRFIETRKELLSGKDFWVNDSVSLKTFLRVDTMVRNLFVGAVFYPIETDSKPIDKGGITFNLTKYDFTKDGIPDEFAYEYSDGRRTQEFGIFLDMNGDEKLDYIVYNGGMISSHDGDFYFYFYHLMDTNYDGLIDTYVSSVVNQPGDEMPDPHRILWISDTDNDKKAEVFNFIDIRNGATISVEAKEGIWRYDTIFGEKELS
jgi:hypothetical protein